MTDAIPIEKAQDTGSPLVSADLTRQMFDKICAVNSISQLLRGVEFEYFSEANLNPTFGLIASLTEDAMLTASDIFLEKEKAGGAS